MNKPKNRIETKRDGRVILHGSYYAQMKTKLRELADNKCERCGMFTVLGDVHHVSGRGAGKRDDRIFVDGEKRLEYVCRKCHGSRHVPEKVVPQKPTDAEFDALLGIDSLQERP